jgi:two-component system sensor histidine kinase KdpD
MLEESHKLLLQGHDLVIGYFEPHGRLDTIAKIEGLPLLPRRRVQYRGRDFEEMDLDAILLRRPEICAVDEFPHTNIPGSRHAKRWEDVIFLLDAGISVLTTMNVQHLESLNDQMREITGIHVRETIPDWVVRQAAEVVLIDLPPQALLNRLQRGVVYGVEKAQQALDNFFQEPTLAALRELALRQTAHEVDIRQAAPTPSPDRILIHVTPRPASVALIRRGRRVADYLNAECFAVAVLPDNAAAPSDLEQQLDFARKLHIESRILEGRDEAQALVDFARLNGVTQIFVARPPKPALPFFHRKPIAFRIVELAKDIQVTVVAEHRP